MKKTNIKKVILPAIAALSFASIAAGTTFALFTDRDDTTINIHAGIVNLSQKAKLVKYESSVDGTEKTFADTETEYTNELVGSTFKINGNTIDISKMVPGDKITLELENINLSNVKTKTRFFLYHSHEESAVDLFDALNISYQAKKADDSDFSEDLFKWHELDAASTEAGDLISKITIVIEFPNSDNLITSREEGIDNYYQDANCKINFVQEMVQGNAVVSDDDVTYSGVSIEKTGEMTRLMSLARFRNLVNTSADGLSGYTITLHDDVDLNNVEWTPIGTKENPFKGVFDGQEHTIKNYKIRGEGKDAGLALFGFIEGSSDDFTYQTNLADFYNAANYAVNLPDEDVFTCAIKNINVSGADVNTTADGWTAAVVSNVKNATISNVHVSNSTLSGNEKVGGVVAFLADQAAGYITNCSTASDVTITTLTGNHAAGILSRVSNTNSRAIIANSTNNATVNCAGVNGSGIAGQAKNVLYYNDTNNGAITGPKRAAGIATDCSGSVFINCKNTGYIKNTNDMSISSDSSAGIAAYLSTSGNNVIVNCNNSGTIEGTTTSDNAKIAGIVAGGVIQTNVILNNSNTGTLINHAANGKTYDISNLSTVATEANANTVAEVIEELAKDNKYVKFTGEATLSENDVLTLNGQEKVEFVNSPENLTIDLTNADAKSFVLIANNSTINLKNGAQKSVTVSGYGNRIILENDQSLKFLTVMNDDNEESAVEINGAIGELKYDGVGNVSAKVKATGSISRCHFSGTGIYALTNRGTISHTQSDANPYGNEHTIASLKACNITIYNYGTIETKENANGVASYAFLFFNGSTVNLYAYNGSKILAEGMYRVITTNGGTQTKVYYQEGAEVVSMGEQRTYPGVFDYYCDVEQID